MSLIEVINLIYPYDIIDLRRLSLVSKDCWVILAEQRDARILPLKEYSGDKVTALGQATSHGNLEALLFLNRKWILTRNDFRKDNRLMLYYAAIGPNPRVVRWIIETFNLTADDVSSRSNAVFQCIAQHGNLDIVQWLVKTFGLTIEDLRVNSAYALLLIIGSGHVNIVEYLIDELGLTVTDISCGAHYEMRGAAASGHLGVLKLLNKKFPTWTAHCQDSALPVFCAACENGHIEVMLWLIDIYNLTPEEIIPGTKEYLFQRLENGSHFKVLEWLKQSFAAGKWLPPPKT